MLSAHARRKYWRSTTLRRVISSRRFLASRSKTGYRKPPYAARCTGGEMKRSGACDARGGEWRMGKVRDVGAQQEECNCQADREQGARVRNACGDVPEPEGWLRGCSGARGMVVGMFRSQRDGCGDVSEPEGWLWMLRSAHRPTV